MNSGCYENDMSKVLLSINVIDKKKLSEIEIKKEDIKFFYRNTNLNEDFIFISAKLKGTISKITEIEKIQSNLIKKKNYLNQVKSRHAEVLLKI